MSSSKGEKASLRESKEHMQQGATERQAPHCGTSGALQGCVRTKVEDWQTNQGYSGKCQATGIEAVQHINC